MLFKLTEVTQQGPASVYVTSHDIIVIAEALCPDHPSVQSILWLRNNSAPVCVTDAPEDIAAALGVRIVDFTKE